jgi:hypothetical protein
MKVVIRVIALPPVLLKGNYEGGNWAIAHGEFSRFFSREIMKVVIRVIALPRFFSRENLRVVKRAISHSECFANALPLIFSREIMKVVNRVIALPPGLLKGKSEGGIGRSRMASASQTRFPSFFQGSRYGR